MRYSDTNLAWNAIIREMALDKALKHTDAVHITAKEINEYREARLMAKFDHSINLPPCLKSRKLSILPISRGEYVLSHFEAYHRFERVNNKPISVSMPEHIQSLDIDMISSETAALNCAYASGVITDFLEDDVLVPTVSGRMKSGSFSFTINDIQSFRNHKLEVNNAQIEIDAAYEGLSSLALFEAKRSISEDFLVRQLYYPYRRWSKEVKKPVRPIYLVYSNGILQLYEYAFEDLEHYNSLKLIKYKSYTWEDTNISLNEILNVLDRVEVVQEPKKVPFPQADSFERVINLCELLAEGQTLKKEITNEYAFDARQSDYYANAGKYLGLIEKVRTSDGTAFELSAKGKRISQLKYKERQLAFCECILQHKVFSETLKLYLQKGMMPSKDEIVGIMKEANLDNVGKETTFYRRASTIRGWIDWILSIYSD